jgi:hypothetical protein
MTGPAIPPLILMLMLMAGPALLVSVWAQWDVWRWRRVERKMQAERKLRTAIILIGAGSLQDATTLIDEVVRDLKGVR